MPIEVEKSFEFSWENVWQWKLYDFSFQKIFFSLNHDSIVDSEMDCLQLQAISCVELEKYMALDEMKRDRMLISHKYSPCQYSNIA